MTTTTDYQVLGVGIVPVSVEYTNTNVLSAFTDDLSSIQSVANKSSLSGVDVTTLKNAMQGLLSLAKNGLNSDPANPNSPSAYLTVEMAAIVSQLNHTLLNSGIFITSNSADYVTSTGGIASFDTLTGSLNTVTGSIAALKNWQSISSATLPAILANVTGAISSNHSLQALVELDYVKAGNDMMGNQMQALSDAVTTTNNSLGYLNQLQNLHNDIKAPVPNQAPITTSGSTSDFQAAAKSAFSNALVPSALYVPGTGSQAQPQKLIDLLFNLSSQYINLQKNTNTHTDPNGPAFSNSLQGTIYQTITDISSYIGFNAISGSTYQTQPPITIADLNKYGTPSSNPIPLNPNVNNDAIQLVSTDVKGNLQNVYTPVASNGVQTATVPFGDTATPEQAKADAAINTAIGLSITTQNRNVITLNNLISNYTGALSINPSLDTLYANYKAAALIFQTAVQGPPLSDADKTTAINAYKAGAQPYIDAANNYNNNALALSAGVDGPNSYNLSVVQFNTSASTNTINAQIAGRNQLYSPPLPNLSISEYSFPTVVLNIPDTYTLTNFPVNFSVNQFTSPPRLAPIPKLSPATFQNIVSTTAKTLTNPNSPYTSSSPTNAASTVNYMARGADGNLYLLGVFKASNGTIYVPDVNNPDKFINSTSTQLTAADPTWVYVPFSGVNTPNSIGAGNAITTVLYNSPGDPNSNIANLNDPAVTFTSGTSGGDLYTQYTLITTTTVGNKTTVDTKISTRVLPSGISGRAYYVNNETAVVTTNGFGLADIYAQYGKTIPPTPLASPLVNGLPLLAIDGASRQSVYGWILDNQDKSTGAGALTSGSVQTNITGAVTSGQNLNDSQKQKLQNFMFIFQQFYQSASAILTSVTQLISTMAQNIAR